MSSFLREALRAPRAVAFALGNALVIAAYTVVDGRGVRGAGIASIASIASIALGVMALRPG